jgi:acetolactate decarboxylase
MNQPKRVQSAHAQGFKVEWVGAQKEVLSGELSAHISLSALVHLDNLYAIGPVAGLKGEITILNGTPSISQIAAEGVEIDTSFCHEACFLAYTQVERWQKVELPNEVKNEEELERYIPEVARLVGIDSAAPFPYLIKGTPRSVAFHILNKTDGLPHNPQMHEQAKVHFHLENVQLTIIGFFSANHRGIFTPGDHAIHQHMVTADGKISGHVDKLSLSSSTILFLPVP